MRVLSTVTALALCAAAGALVQPRTARADPGPRPVIDADLLGVGANRAEWLTYGRDYGSHRYSPLDQITPATIARLRPAWAFSTGSTCSRTATASCT